MTYSVEFVRGQGDAEPLVQHYVWASAMSHASKVVTLTGLRGRHAQRLGAFPPAMPHLVGLGLCLGEFA